MRISDWSSDVCSSDLPHHRRSGGSRELLPPPLRRQGRVGEACLWDQREPWAPPPSLPLPSQGEGPEQELAAEAAATGIRCDRRSALRTTSTPPARRRARRRRSEEHTSKLQSQIRTSY